MKKVIKILILAIIAIFIIPDIPHYYKELSVSFITLPKEYNDIKTFEEFTTNSKYNITLLKNEDEYTSLPTITDDSIICVRGYTKQNTLNDAYSTFYKINKTGNVIDSLHIKDEGTYEHYNYLLNVKKGYYITWLIDGDTAHKPFNLIGNGKIYTKEEFEKYTQGAVYSGYGRWIEDANSGKTYSRTVYFKENQWNAINTENYYEVEGNSDRINNNLPTKKLEEMAILDYFHKEEWVGNHFFDFGFYINGREADHWRGVAYYTLRTYNDISFKIKWTKMYEHDKSIGCYDYHFYEDPLKNFLLVFKQVEGVGSNYYLIQKKSVQTIKQQEKK